MARLRTVLRLIVVSSFLFSLAIFTPAPTLAAPITVADNSAYPCTQAGLTNAVAAAVTSDPDNPGLVTFSCADSTIEFNAEPPASILIGDFSDTTDFIHAVIIDGSNNGNPITLDGVADDGIDANFFGVGSDIDPENPTPQSLLTIQHMTLQNGTYGAIISEDSTLNVIDVTFTNNQSPIGGAIINSLGDLTVSQSTFSNNRAQVLGGGAIFSRWGTLSVSNSTFTGNSTGPGILGSGGGGAISTEDASANVSQSTFSNNQSGAGGGAVASNADTLIVSQSTFTNNQAALGGAIYNSKVATVSQSTFTNNRALGGLVIFGVDLGSGGAISSTGTLDITQSSFNNNQATNYPGGAIFAGGMLTVGQTSFNENQASNGGAINASGTLTISQSSFIENQATGLVGGISGLASGGAIGITGTLTVSESSFTGNEATGLNGGAIANAGIATISRSTFIDNDAAAFGGAVQSVFDPGDNLTQIISSTFSGNTAGTSGSSVAFLPRVPEVVPTLPPSTISWSTIVQPDGTSPALHLETPLSITGLILAGSTDDHCAFILGGSLTDSYTLANNDSCNLTGTGSFQDIDPLLGALDPYIIAIPTPTFGGANGAYHPLSAGSPAIDGGPPTGGCDTGILPDTDPEPDQRGTPRPSIFVCDIGAIETADFRPTLQSVDIPATIDEGVPATFTINASDPNSINLLYTIDCDNNGIPEIENSSSNQLTCTYPDNGDFTSQITISDGTNTYSQDFNATVNNLAPVMSTVTAAPGLVAINQDVNVQTSATDVIADTLTFTIDCGNGTTKTADDITSTDGTFNANDTCQYTEPGRYTFSVTATDDDSGVSTAMTTTVDVVSATFSSTTINEGQSVTITVNEQSTDPLTYFLDCNTNDATDAAPTSNPTSCAYPDNGSFNGVMTVARDTESVSFPFTITVNNLAPIMTSVIATPTLVAINNPVSVQMTATDVPADTLTFTLNCGIGPSSTTGTIDSDTGTFSTSSICTYTQPGHYTISASATDDDNGASDTLTTTVHAVIPTTLCANQWNGAIRIVDSCSRSETQITLPQNGPLALCVNNWNGATRTSTNCTRSEHTIIALGDNTISTCINDWTGTLRITDRCTRSEHPHQL